MPLGFDMPLDALSEYAGTNPCPADFDAYWAEAMAEVEAIDPEIELVPATLQTGFARCDHLYFKGVGGARIHAKLLRPRTQDGPGAAVVHYHGYTGSSRDWFDLLAYPAAGITVAAIDVRGQAGLSNDVGGHSGWTLSGHLVRGLGEDPRNLFYRGVFCDCAQLVHIVKNMPEVDPSRIGTAGRSQGGALALIAGALVPDVKRVESVFPFLCDYQRNWDLDLNRFPYAEISEWFRRFDPQHKREAEIFTQLGYIDVQHFAERIEGEVTLYVGLMDQVCPPSTQFAAFNKIRSPKSVELYPDFGHDDFPGIRTRIYEKMLTL